MPHSFRRGIAALPLFCVAIVANHSGLQGFVAPLRILVTRVLLLPLH